jgi:hypothetical protein
VNTIVKILFTVIFISHGLRSSVLAQPQSGEPSGNAAACANGASTSPNQSLSDKLAQSNGVICPPKVDRAIKAPTPNAGKMPVIPPPGSPGGNPNVQPK